MHVLAAVAEFERSVIVESTCFPFSKKRETAQLHEERRRVGTRGRGLETARARLISKQTNREQNFSDKGQWLYPEPGIGNGYRACTSRFKQEWLCWIIAFCYQWFLVFALMKLELGLVPLPL